MAKVEVTVLSLAILGRVTGPVFTKRRKTAYIRRRYRPSEPSPKQRQARDAFAAVDLAWRQLSRAIRDEWNAYQSWKKSWGYNRFQGINIPRELAGLPLILKPGDIP